MNAALMLVCLAGTASVGQRDTVFRAPSIEVRRDRWGVVARPGRP